MTEDRSGKLRTKLRETVIPNLLRGEIDWVPDRSNQALLAFLFPALGTNFRQEPDEALERWLAGEQWDGLLDALR